MELREAREQLRLRDSMTSLNASVGENLLMNVWKVYVDGSNLLRVQHVSFNLIRVVINNPGCICCLLLLYRLSSWLGWNILCSLVRHET